MTTKMRKLSYLLPFFLTLAFIVILERPELVTSSSIPPMGQLMSPYSGFWKNAVPEEHFFRKEMIDNQHLTAPVTVQTDTLGVPHVFAQNLEDAVYVQGYLTARDRLWQMDFSTRAVAGRLAEILGSDLIDYDQRQRRIGLLRAAKETIEAWKKSPKNYHLLEQFCAGINAYIDQLTEGDLPVEFKLMGYRPSHWSPLQVALQFKGMAKTLNFGHNDIEMTNLRIALGQKAFDFLYPEYNPKQKPVVPDFGQWDSLKIQLTRQHPSWVDSAYSMVEPLPKMNEGIGSNNWAVSGKKTKSGSPILCNDPHLPLTLPSIWYMLQIHTPEVNSMGVSLAGIPGIIIGFNERIAWGVTNVGQDVTDWYRISWTDKSHTNYLLDGKEVPIQVVYDTIYIKNKNPKILATKITKWGPIVYDKKDKPYSGMALKWLSNEPSKTFELGAFVGFMKSQNYQDFVASAKDFTYPAQNMIFASVDGDIAIRVQGKFPIKNPEQGRFIQDGSKHANDWLGYIPQDQIPQLKNPDRGFVFSANQNSTPPSYPYYYNGGFGDFRCRTIYNKLQKMNHITIEDMMKMQQDDYNIGAADALPKMLAVLDTSRLKAGALPLIDQLQKWDYHFRKDSLEPVLFTVWYRKLVERTWDEIAKLPDSIAVRYPENWRMVELMDDTTHQYFDLLFTDEVETFSDISTLAFGDMMETLAEKIASHTYHWKDYNQPTINHLARINPFSRKGLDVGGQAYTINAMNGSFGPSWRMIVELSSPIKAYGVLPGGASGNPGSPFYDNLVDDWATGKYYQLLFLKKLDMTQQTPFLKTETFN